MAISKRMRKSTAKKVPKRITAKQRVARVKNIAIARRYRKGSGRIKLQRVGQGYYSGKKGDITFDIYKADSKKYWSSTVTIGKYGSNRYREESFQGYSKKEVVGYVNKFVNENL